MTHHVMRARRRRPGWRVRSQIAPTGRVASTTVELTPPMSATASPEAHAARRGDPPEAPRTSGTRTQGSRTTASNEAELAAHVTTMGATHVDQRAQNAAGAGADPQRLGQPDHPPEAGREKKGQPDALGAPHRDVEEMGGAEEQPHREDVAEVQRLDRSAPHALIPEVEGVGHVRQRRHEDGQLACRRRSDRGPARRSPPARTWLRRRAPIG